MVESFRGSATEFQYTKLTPEEQQARGILGRLVGPISDTRKPTRNGRGYGMECWEKTFNDEIFKEKLENRCLVGEFGHPADRTEIDPDKIAICLAEMPKLNEKDGLIYGVFDILNTPCGNILKTMCDYGSKIGVSSRATGDTYTDNYGNESVDPDSFELECWDAVLTPSVKEARQDYVHESFSKELKGALCESYRKASMKDKRVIKETLDDLEIDINETLTVKDIIDDFKELGEDTIVEVAPLEIEGVKYDCDIDLGEEKDGKVTLTYVATPIEDIDTQKSDDIDKEVSDKEGNKQELATDSGNLEVVESLKEALVGKKKSEEQVLGLQEQLAVNDVKVGKLEEELSRYKEAYSRLGVVAKESKEAKAKVSELEKELSKKNGTIDLQKRRIESLLSQKQNVVADKETSSKGLNESISAKNREISNLNESITKLNETLKQQKNEYEKTIKTLKENLANIKSTASNQVNNLQEELNNSNGLVESWKQLATQTINGYIKNKATMYGVTTNEIKNRLPETYTIKDVDEVCESLQTMQLNLSRLPFNTNSKVRATGRIVESHSQPTSEEDMYDDQLLRMAHLK